MDQAGGLGVGGNLLSREVEGFAGPEYGCFKIRASPGEDFFMAWKVQGVTAQFAGFGIWKRHAYTIALHNLANTCRNLLQQLGQLQLAHDPVRQIEKKLQSLLCARVIYRYGDLIGDEGQEPLFIQGVCVLQAAGKGETAQLSMCGAQWQHIDRVETQFREPIDYLRKTSFLIRNADQNRLLILVNPPRRCFLLWNIL